MAVKNVAPKFAKSPPICLEGVMEHMQNIAARHVTRSKDRTPSTQSARPAATNPTSLAAAANFPP